MVIALGNRTRREIALSRKKLHERLGRGADLPYPEPESDTPARALDLRLPDIFARKDADDPMVRELMGIAAADSGSFDWPSERVVAQRLNIPRHQVAETMARMRERWSSRPAT